MAKALYRKYRAKSLTEIVGQQHIVTILSAALAQNRINHAFLFTGPRGVGKTSIARILAHEINKLPYSEEANHFDIIEIDAASNRRIDDIRELREKIHIAPSSAPYKIYIIDEVHMLTGESFNALLKTLEEPPKHAIFILATTEAHKLPATIISRTQRFHFQPVPQAEVVAHLRHIANKEKIAIADEALQLIAEHGEGSFRDSISLLDQLSALGKEEITAATVESALGLASKQLLAELAQAVRDGRLNEIVSLLQSIEEKGTPAPTIANQLIAFFRTVITTEKQAPHLITALLEVDKSSNPSAKLLSLLIIFGSKAQPRTVATAVAVAPTLTVPVPPPEKTLALTSQEPKKGSAKSAKAAITDGTHAILEHFNWNDVIEALRQDYVSVYGVIKHASAEYEEGVLRLYFPYALHKKKIDDAKYRTQLMNAIEKIYKVCPVIETVVGHVAPKDETAASVAALMGGGQEVHVDA